MSARTMTWKQACVAKLNRGTRKFGEPVVRCSGCGIEVREKFWPVGSEHRISGKKLCGTFGKETRNG